MVRMIGSNVPAWNCGWLAASCHLVEHIAARYAPNATECDYRHFGGELVKMVRAANQNKSKAISGAFADVEKFAAFCSVLDAILCAAF